MEILIASISTLLVLLYHIITNKKQLEEIKNSIIVTKSIPMTENLAEVLNDLKTHGYSVVRIDPDSILIRSKIKR